MHAEEYRRKQILDNNMQFKQGWMDLIYSIHAMERLKQRLLGDLIVYPRKINISKLNIYKGYSYDGIYLHKVIVRLEFKPAEWIFLVISPNTRVVKSLWFANKKHVNQRRDSGYQKTGNRTPMDLFPPIMEGNGRQ
jgi:hypothetical protein